MAQAKPTTPPAQELAEALTAARDQDGRFSASVFFTHWFKDKGSRYFFLFKKNLKVTNIQFAELLALIQTHTTSRYGDRPILHFASAQEFKISLQRIADSFVTEANNGNFDADLCQRIATLYDPLIKRTVVVDSLFGSCAVSVPPGMDLDLQSICGYSGYVHSCGRVVFIRKMYKTAKVDFFNAIRDHLGKYPSPEARDVFTFYAHEDFTKVDRRFAGELRDGLDEVKLYIEKYYMGGDRLANVYNELREEFSRDLQISGRQEAESSIKEDGPMRKRSFWLIADHDISSDPKHHSDQRFFICYEQIYRNQNPLHLFDENKPAWIDHTTIPHTLVGAMINITRPAWPSGSVVIVDPFVGSGTTWLECLKFKEVQAKGGDLCPMSPLLALDNLEFLCCSTDELDEYVASLRGITPPAADPHIVPTGRRRTNDRPISEHEWATNRLKALVDGNEGGEAVFTPEVVDELRGKSQAERLHFYVAMRTYKRGYSSFLREEKGGVAWWHAYADQASELAQQLERLSRLKLRWCQAPRSNDHMALFPGPFSSSCAVRLNRLETINRARRKSSAIVVRPASALEENSCDVIVTDPPYSFNTDDDRLELAEILNEAVVKMVRALRDNGQLVMGLPDWSHSGRQFPLFAMKDVITQQVLVAAHESGRAVVQVASTVPPPSHVFRPPYYWESERALRRAILHFTFKSMNRPSKEAKRKS